MNVKIIYVVSVHMSGETILEYHKVRQYRPNRNQGSFFFSWINMINEMSVKATLMVMDSQSIDNVASNDAIKRQLVD